MSETKTANGKEEAKAPEPHNEAPPEQEPVQRPVHVVRDGNMSASIWQRLNSQSGETYFDVTVANNWKDEKGVWRSNNNFSEYQMGRIPDLSANTRAIMVGLRHEKGLVRENTQEQMDFKAGKEAQDSYLEKRQGKTQGPAKKKQQSIQ